MRTMKSRLVWFGLAECCQVLQDELQVVQYGCERLRFGMEGRQTQGDGVVIGRKVTAWTG